MQKLEKRQISPHCILSCLYFLLLPTTIAVDSAGNSILKLATIPIGLFFFIWLIFSDKKLQINGVHLALLFYTLTVVATLFCDAGSTSVSFVIGYGLNAALYLCLTVVPYNKKELELMESVQILLLVILNFMTLFSGGSEDNRTTLMIMGQTSDPNYFVGFFIFPLTIALKRLASGKHFVAYGLLIAVSLYSIFLSGSRGGLLAIAATFAGFALLYPSSVLKRMLFFFGGLFAIIILFVVLKPILPANIVERMTLDAVTESGGTGRLDIWRSIIQEIVDQPERLFLGRGINATHSLFINGTWKQVVAHNHLLQTLYNQGIVGTLSFLALVIICFLRCRKRRKTVAIAMLGMMALSLSLSFNQTVRSFWNLIAYAAFVFPDSHITTINDGGLPDHERA